MATELKMTLKEADRLAVMKRVENKNIRLEAAARELGTSYRQAKRIWRGYKLKGAKYFEAPSRTRQVSLSAARIASSGPSRGLEHRYHLHSPSKRVCVPRGCDRLVQPPGALPSPVQQLGDEVSAWRPSKRPSNATAARKSSIPIRGCNLPPNSS